MTNRKAISSVLAEAVTHDRGFSVLQERLRQKRSDRVAADQAAKQQQQKEGISRRPILKLHDFIQQAWSTVLHPSEPFLSGWYIELICEYLTLLTAVKHDKLDQIELRDKLLNPYDRAWGDLSQEMQALSKLVINISPRCSKSTIVTVMWPCWEWLTLPWVPMMGLSYAQSLASDHNDDRRSIITSEWYQELCDGMELSRSKNRVTEFKNDSQGLMFGKGLDSAVTGVGAITLSWDDPNNPTKVESDVIRDRTTRDFRDYSVTRLNNAYLASQVVVQQRTHELDISGVIHAEHDSDWHFLVIPMEAEAIETHNFPLSDRVVERHPGELMHPDRFPPDLVAALKRDNRIWAGRYQQRPSAAGGGLFQIRNWKLYNPRRLPNFRRSLLSLDCSFKDLSNSDYNALALIGETVDSHQIILPRTYTDRDTGQERNYTEQARDYYVRDLWRKKADITTTEAALQQMASDYPEAITKLIEDKANGPAIVSRLKNVLPGITPWNPGRASKEERAMSIQPIHQRAGLLLPIDDQYIASLEAMGLDSITIGQWWDLNPPKQESDAEFAPVPDWAKTIINEFAKFPRSANDDTVDAIGQAVIYCQSMQSADKPAEALAVPMSLEQRNKARRQHRPDRKRGLR